MHPTKFWFIWPSGFREDFQKSTNQKKELPVVTMFVNGLGRNKHSLQRAAHRCFLPSFGSFGKAVSEEKNLKNQQIRKKLPVVAMFVNGSGRNEHSLQRTFHRCFLPSFGSFGQAVSDEKICLNLPIRNKNCLWRPYLLMERDEMSNFIEDLPQMLPTKFQFIWLSFKGED